MEPPRRFEAFQYEHATWNIADAYRQIPDDTPIQQIPSSDLIGRHDRIQIDREWAEHPDADLDVDQPLLAVRWVDGTLLVIDGWHRLWRAHHYNHPTVPVIVLTDAQADHARVD